MDHRTGVRNHMTSDLDLLNKNITVKEIEKPKKVHLPNGDISLVTHFGDNSITARSTISNAFCVLNLNIICCLSQN